MLKIPHETVRFDAELKVFQDIHAYTSIAILAYGNYASEKKRSGSCGDLRAMYWYRTRCTHLLAWLAM